MRKRSSRRRAGRPRLLALVGLVCLLATACTTKVSGTGAPGAPALAPNVSASQFTIVGDAGTHFDQLVRNSLTDVEQFWTKAFPAISGGRTLKPLSGGVYSVQTGQPDTAEACMKREPKAADNNAFYCSLDDAFAYDRTGLVNVVAEKLGDNFAPLVFAHEFGHLIQNRLDIDRASIYMESQADCASGAFMAAEAGASTITLTNRHFDIDPKTIDTLALGMILLRDSQPHTSAAEGSDGNGFDRISAFSDGFNNGVAYCYNSDWVNRKFTERPYATDSDYQAGGNQTLQEVLDTSSAGLISDLNRFWKSAFTSIGKAWKPVTIKEAAHPPCATDSGSDFGYCPSDNTVYYSTTVAESTYDSFPSIGQGPGGQVAIDLNGPGDYSLGALFAYGWGSAVRSQLGLSTVGQDELLAASCYVGAYSKDINVTTGRQFTLSPSDMDEATVTVLKTVGDPDILGSENTTGFQRVAYFKKGYFGGLTVC